jgi:two-component system OmpR family response regulator
MRVLLVEDDRMVGEAVEAALSASSYAVDWIDDGQLAETQLRVSRYDLVLLDLGLPRRDGTSLLRELRAHGDGVPVIVITARERVDERIRVLDSGADDYVVKPFEMGELLARMRAVIRRKGGQSGPRLSNGELTLDPATREAATSERRARLSAREFAVLRALLVRPGAILSRAELEDRVYGSGQEVESNAIEFLIHAVRRKLGGPSIVNVRGVGWMVRKDGTADRCKGV